MFDPWQNQTTENREEPRGDETVPAPRDDSGGPGDGLPVRIGRYRVERLLGQGGFGLVYMAYDEQLRRYVAVKVPHHRLIQRPEDAELYLAEARHVASLDHPNIVPVYDVGGTDEYPCFVVSKFIDGHNLAAGLCTVRYTWRQAAELVLTVAGALDHAHKQGLVHRDVKPGNILIDPTGMPFVVDFGLALREEDLGKGPRYAGTPRYMSPEQAWGEGHRVDCRSDIFSLGIVFYEVLLGHPPFQGETREVLREQITTHEPKPPRQVDEQIPRELDRICLKALAKRASERYPAARDMADDLRYFLAEQPDASRSPLDSQAPPGPPASTMAPVLHSATNSTNLVKVVPKGLRSFDEHDAEFFLELLPGPRDRNGLPEGLRFWKAWVEETDLDRTAPVGLIYGPSGCGKSSLVKAGLLPRLSERIITVYVEATPQETEARLRGGLKKCCADLPDNLDLKDALAALRRGQALPEGRKVLIVLDQFEQWLHARREEENAALVQALRQCDGEHVQCIVMVRDDFWMAATRFMRAVEVRLLEGENSAAVDLFDPSHAGKVLASFGRAFGKLSGSSADRSKDQDHFLKEAVAGLVQDGKVVCVRLALFAEMMKGKPWTRGALGAVGGSRGVGFTFLEESFSAATAPAAHRYHEAASRAVLRALLPESGTDIKGHMRSYADLLEASGYSGRPQDFDDLIRILDAELRLITPTDPEGAGAHSEGASRLDPARMYYQLTHDYLVHSLRDWLTRKQRETRKGRAELRLEERSQLWSSHPENRFLPSMWEWASIRILTRRRGWTEAQRQMMKHAGRMHGLVALAALLLIALGIVGVVEARGSLRASGLVGSLRTAETSEVPSIIRQLEGLRRWADPELKRMLRESAPASREHLHASMVLLEDDSSQLGYLTDRLLSASTTELPVLQELLQPHQATLVPWLWAELDAAQRDDSTVLAAGSSLARYAPDDPRWPEHGRKIAEVLVRSPLFLGAWRGLFRPVRTALVPPLAALLRDHQPNRKESERELAATLLADFISDQPDVLADLLMDADPTPFSTLYPVAHYQREMVAPTLLAELSKEPGTLEPPAGTRTADELIARQARAGAALIRMDQAREVFPRLRNQADPRLRGLLINWLHLLGIEPRRLAAELERLDGLRPSAAGPGTPFNDAVLLHPETSTRRALILALGTYPANELTPDLLEPLTARLLQAYRNDPDSGVHGAIEWTLGRWGLREEACKIDRELARKAPRPGRRWFVNSQGQTLAVIDGPVEFLMGSPRSEPHHHDDETLHRRRIPRRFAIATKEVSLEHFEAFLREHPEVGLANEREFSPHAGGPASKPSWYLGAAFCNWLSDREGLQRCYEPNAQGQYAEGMTIRGDALTRTGYRLPTEAEWEFSCRAGTLTSRYFGTDRELLKNYAWFNLNADGLAWPCGTLLPNDLGLFDMLGNLYEWCQDLHEEYKVGPGGVIVDELSKAARLVQTDMYILRGSGFVDVQGDVRSALRIWNYPHNRLGSYGFRIARTLP